MNLTLNDPSPYLQPGARANGAIRTGPSVSHLSAPAQREARLSLAVRRDLAWSLADITALDALVRARPGVGVFLTPAWLSGFLAEPPAGFEPSILVLLERGALRGIAPLGLRQTSTHVRVTLLGGGTGSDRVDLLGARGYEAIFSDMFLNWLDDSFGSKGFVLELRDVPGDSAIWGAIRRASMEKRFPLVLVPREVHALPYLTLDEAPSIRDALSPYSATSSARHRRLLERRGVLKVTVLRDADSVLMTFDELVQLLHARWGEGSVLHDLRRRRFHRHVLPLLSRDGKLRMIRLTVGERPIAVFYGLATGSWWGYYLSGYDRAWAGRIHLGQITLDVAIDLAVNQGAAEFDFLKGAERIKYHWPVRDRMTVDADVYSGKPGAQFSRAIRATRETAGALANAARGFFTSQNRA
jgi:hypothetical protein